MEYLPTIEFFAFHKFRHKPIWTEWMEYRSKLRSLAHWSLGPFKFICCESHIIMSSTLSPLFVPASRRICTRTERIMLILSNPNQSSIIIIIHPSQSEFFCVSLLPYSVWRLLFPWYPARQEIPGVSLSILGWIFHLTTFNKN